MILHPNKGGEGAQKDLTLLKREAHKFWSSFIKAALIVWHTE